MTAVKPLSTEDLPQDKPIQPPQPETAPKEQLDDKKPVTEQTPKA